MFSRLLALVDYSGGRLTLLEVVGQGRPNRSISDDEDQRPHRGKQAPAAEINKHI
jgi:hypothetical protein